MKIFVDTANLQDIEEALRRGFVEGVTTNPSLLAKEPKSNFEKHIGKIVDLIKEHRDGAHLSVEVFSSEPKEILKQAKKFKKIFNYSALSIKIQVGWDELEAIHMLSKEGISVNCTACMSVMQGIMASRAGARYISFFWGRIRDGASDVKFLAQRNECLKKQVLNDEDFNPYLVVNRARRMLNQDNLGTEIIAGSIRGVTDIRDAGLAGAHIVTVPPKFFKDMVSHFKTEEVVQQFLSDFKKWLR